MYNHECFYSELVTLITTMHYVKSFLFFPFGESSGLEMAGWLAGLGAGQAGWAGRQAGWSWQADLDVGPDLKLDVEAGGW